MRCRRRVVYRRLEGRSAVGIVGSQRKTLAPGDRYVLAGSIVRIAYSCESDLATRRHFDRRQIADLRNELDEVFKRQSASPLTTAFVADPLAKDGT